MVGQRPLEPLIGVRIPVPQHLTGCHTLYYNQCMRKVINISLPEHLYREVEQDVKSGRYGTKSELFRELLRIWKAGALQETERKFDAGALLENVQKHAGIGGPKDLSTKHDFYLYGA